MARNPYYPFDADFEEIFVLCGQGDKWSNDFGGNKGWSVEDFNSIVDACQDYLNALFDDDDPDNDPPESYFELLETGIQLAYWSSEGHIIG